jgi:hypothetical protein
VSRKRKRPIFQNWQWQVTHWGIEACKPESYSIKADQLTATREVDGELCYDVPLHMLTKREWVIMDWFKEAFLKGMKYHHGGHDPEMFNRTLKTIRAQKAALLGQSEVLS